jgi:hypothetical protein
MNKILLLLLVFAIFSCEKETKKKVIAPIPKPIPIIAVDDKSVIIDSALFKPFGGKILTEFYRATGFRFICTIPIIAIFFGKQKRSLSSGCVRVQNPLELAEYLLGGETNWTVEKITEILKSKKTKYIRIPKEVNIYILYWTAWCENNTLIFRDDIYNLDAVLNKKL